MVVAHLRPYFVLPRNGASKPSSKGILAILFFSAALLLSCFHSLSRYHPDKAGCAMSYMYQSYAKLKSFDSQHTRLANRYSLYLYRDAKYDGPFGDGFKPDGTPVIFIPGNAGSYRQVRSIASLAAEISFSSQSSSKLDFYTMDFQEDFTAFHGRTLLDQAEYVNDAIKYILKLYDKESPDIPHPKSVIIIGHSMGGFIARSLVVLNNYVPESINTIVTLATPHIMPPLTFDSEMTEIYTRVNQYWVDSFSEKNVNRNPLSSVALVSIAGGTLDNMIQSDYTLISPLVSPSNAFSTISTTIPGVWTSIDHLAIVWCHQCRYALVNSLLEIVDPSSPSKTRSLSERMAIFSKYLLSGFEPYEYNYNLRNTPTTPESYIIRSSDTFSSFSVSSTSLRYTPSKRFYLVPIPKSENSQGYMAHIFRDPEEDSLYFLCANMHAEKTNQRQEHIMDLTESPEEEHIKYYNCTKISAEDSISIPYSRKDSLDAFESGYLPNIGLKSAQYHLFNVSRDLKNYDFIATIPSRRSMSAEEPSIAIHGGFKPTTVEISSSSFSLMLKSAVVELRPLQYVDISLTSATSGLISYRAYVNSKSSCEAPPSESKFTFFMRQYVLDPFESKWHVNIGNSRTQYISFHGLKSPYVPYNKKENHNLHLQVFSPFFEDRTAGCGPVTISISVDIWGSLSNYVIRYRTLIVPFSFSVAAAVLLFQFFSYLATSELASFSEGLGWIIGKLLVPIAPGLAGAYFFFSFGITRALFYGVIQYPYAFITRSKSLSYLEGFAQNDMLIGESQFDLLLVTPVAYTVAVGFVLLVYYSILYPISKLGKYFATIDKLKEPRGEQKSLQYTLLISAGVMTVLTSTLLPYTITLFLGLLYILFQYGKASYYVQRQGCLDIITKKEKTEVEARFAVMIPYYLIESLSVLLLLSVIPVGIPIFIAWIHQGIENSFFAPFSSHHNILYLIPMFLAIKSVLTLVECIATCPTRAKSQTSLSLSTFPSSKLIYVGIFILKYSAVYSLLFGFLHVYSLQNFSFLFSVYIFVLVHFSSKF